MNLRIRNASSRLSEDRKPLTWANTKVPDSGGFRIRKFSARRLVELANPVRRRGENAYSGRFPFRARAGRAEHARAQPLQSPVGQMPPSVCHVTTPLAPNYAPLDVTLAAADGVWVTDVDGTRYLDFLAAYSAVNFGHLNPRLIAAAQEQLGKLDLVSRAFAHELLLPFASALTTLTRTEMMLPMNTGAEAVETAIKAARRWGYLARNIPEEQAEIIVAEGAFHGRTTTIVSFSSDPAAREHFGPYTPGFVTVPYGDADAVAAAITDRTAAILMEPIQGESGVIIPPADYLPRLRKIADDAGILLVLDEVQSGLGRTGHVLDQWRVGVNADLTCLGKALGGGILPVSAVVGREDVLGLLTAGTHGSTFGGHPLACRVGLEVTRMLEEGAVLARIPALAAQLATRLDALASAGLVGEVRHVGLWAGVDVDRRLGHSGREVCERLVARGVLAKETHGSTIRLSPPLTIEADQIDLAMDALEDALRA